MGTEKLRTGNLYRKVGLVGDDELLNETLSHLNKINNCPGVILIYGYGGKFRKRHGSLIPDGCNVIRAEHSYNMEYTRRLAHPISGGEAVVETPPTHMIQIHQVPLYVVDERHEFELGSTKRYPFAVPVDQNARDDMLLRFLNEIKTGAQEHKVTVIIPHNPATFPEPSRFNNRFSAMTELLY